MGINVTGCSTTDNMYFFHLSSPRRSHLCMVATAVLVLSSPLPRYLNAKNTHLGISLGFNFHSHC